MSVKSFKDIIPLLGGINYKWAEVLTGYKEEQYIEKVTNTVTGSTSSTRSGAESSAKNKIPSGGTFVSVSVNSSGSRQVSVGFSSTYFYFGSVAQQYNLTPFYSSETAARNASTNDARNRINSAYPGVYNISVSTNVYHQGHHGSSYAWSTATGYVASDYIATVTYTTDVTKTRQVPVYEWRWVE